MISEKTYALLALHVYEADPEENNKPILPTGWTELNDQPTGTNGFVYGEAR
jgi:hypothetical protein